MNSKDEANLRPRVTAHRLAVALLLIAGVICWIFLSKSSTGGARPLIATAIAVTVAVLLMINRNVRDRSERLLDGLGTPSRRVRAITAGILALAAGICFLQTALWQGR